MTNPIKTYIESVETLRSLMGDLSKNFFSRVVMAEHVSRNASHLRNEKHQKITWLMDSDISANSMIASGLVLFIAWFAYFATQIFKDSLPVDVPLLLSTPAAAFIGYALFFKFAGYRVLAEARDAYLLMADELGPVMHSKAMQEKIVLLERGFNLPATDYYALAAYLLDLHTDREKKALQEAFENEYGYDEHSPENTAAESTSEPEINSEGRQQQAEYLIKPTH